MTSKIVNYEGTVKQLRESTGMTRKEFSEYFGIPVGTVRDWEQSKRNPPKYVVDMAATILRLNITNPY